MGVPLAFDCQAASRRSSVKPTQLMPRSLLTPRYQILAGVGRTGVPIPRRLRTITAARLGTPPEPDMPAWRKVQAALGVRRRSENKKPGCDLDSTSWYCDWEYLREHIGGVSADEARKLLTDGGYVLLDVSLDEEYKHFHPKGSASAPFFRRVSLSSPSLKKVLQFSLCGLQGVRATEENPDFMAQVRAALPKEGCKGIIVACAFGGTLVKSFHFPEGKESRSLRAAARIAKELNTAGLSATEKTRVLHLKGGLNQYFLQGGDGEGEGSEFEPRVGIVQDDVQPPSTGRQNRNRKEEVPFLLDLFYSKEDRERAYQAYSLDKNGSNIAFSEPLMLISLLSPILLTVWFLGPLIQLRLLEFLAAPPWEQGGAASAGGSLGINLSDGVTDSTIVSATLRDRLMELQAQQQQQAASFAQEAAQDRLLVTAEAPLGETGTVVAAAAAATFFAAATVLLPARYLMTWYPKVERARKEEPWNIITQTTDPWLRPLRKIFPGEGLEGVDPSPLVALVLMSYLDEALLGGAGVLLGGVPNVPLQEALQSMIITQRILFLIGALGLGFRRTGVL
ncbi:hypothetical protein CYMTET_19732 [Cymbomonas tetramitiformis]|uniref:Rhodanese domain-containing protein n=1 Tax=Cymbomonas tetramitiformis TaxID=36881 RepID=A0AAE0G5G6_9CHLO|nr:hypothetical protein CYMTET_19732 [Cymbomonas tetramitiformis]